MDYALLVDVLEGPKDPTKEHLGLTERDPLALGDVGLEVALVRLENDRPVNHAVDGLRKLGEVGQDVRVFAKPFQRFDLLLQVFHIVLLSDL